MNTSDEIGGNAGSAADKTAAVMPDNANNEDPAFAGETSDSGTGLFALLGYDASGKPVSFDLAGAAGLLVVTGLSGSSGVQEFRTAPSVPSLDVTVRRNSGSFSSITEQTSCFQISGDSFGGFRILWLRRLE